MKSTQKNGALALILILLIVLLRVIAQEIYWFNFVPLVAISLFSGARLGRQPLAYLLPLVGLLASDFYFHFFTQYPGFYGPEQGLVYLGFALVAILGSGIRVLKPAPILGFTLLGSLLFFLVSNLGIYFTGYWGSGWDGLTRTYYMALPFFRNSLIADLTGSALLFSIYALSLRFPLGRSTRSVKG